MVGYGMAPPENPGSAPVHPLSQQPPGPPNPIPRWPGGPNAGRGASTRGNPKAEFAPSRPRSRTASPHWTGKPPGDKIPLDPSPRGRGSGLEEAMEAKTKAEVLRRLRSVAGHVEGIARMVE
jgi:hypothetical protein